MVKVNFGMFAHHYYGAAEVTKSCMLSHSPFVASCIIGCSIRPSGYKGGFALLVIPPHVRVGLLLVLVQFKVQF